MGFFETFYASDVQHPILLWVAALGALVWTWTRPGLASALRRTCTALCALSLLDAWLTSRWIYGLGQLEGALASAVPLTFVLAGDARYLLLLESATARGGLELCRRAVLATAGLTLIVPIASQLVLWALPSDSAGPRVLFLVYELLFVALTWALLRWHPGPRRAPWLRSVSHFVLLYYGLWAAADALILGTGADWGFGLRVIPNLLYYGGLIAVIASSAAGARSGGAGSNAAP